MYKKLTLTSVLIAGFAVASCQNQPNTLTFTPPSAVGPFNVQNQTASVNVNVRDLQANQAVSQYVNNGQLYPIYAQPSVTELFRQSLQQDLNSKGFRILPTNAPINVTAHIKQFYANINQGNLRYKIEAFIKLTVQVQSAKGKYNKNIEIQRSQEGAFNAKTEEIQKVLGQVFDEAVKELYRDQEISNAIHRLSH